MSENFEGNYMKISFYNIKFIQYMKNTHLAVYIIVSGHTTFAS